MMSLAELAERLAKDAERAKVQIEKDRQYYRENRERWKTVYNPRKQAKQRREDV